MEVTAIDASNPRIDKNDLREPGHAMPDAIQLIDRGAMRTQGRTRRQRALRGGTLLEIRGVETGYGKLKILRGIDMNVGAQGIVALLGGNGTGKSTLLKAISGIIPVWSGEILFDGEPIHVKRPHEIVRAGLVQVTQGKDSYPGMTVEENLMLGAHARSDKAAVRGDLEKVYAFFPILNARWSLCTPFISACKH